MIKFSDLNFKINIFCIASALGDVLEKMTVEQAKMLLSVSEKPTEEEIKNSYKKLVKYYHPDKETGNITTFKLLTKAKDILLKHLKEKKPVEKVKRQHQWGDWYTKENQ